MAVSALIVVAFASFLHGSRGEHEITIYRRQITEIEVHDIIGNHGYNHGLGLALILIGVLMILTAISAIWVQAKKKPAQMSPEKKPAQEKSEARPGPHIIIHDNCPNPQPIRKRRAPKDSGDTTHHKVHESASNSDNVTTVYYSKDGFKTGIFHVDKHCSHLKLATKVYVKSINFWRAQNHRPCKICGNQATCASLRG